MRLSCFALAFAALPIGHSASAAPYRLVGTYAMMEFNQCAAAFTTSSNNGAITSVNQTQVGILSIGVGYATFTPSTNTSGTVAVTQTAIVGGSLAIDSSTFNMTSESVNQSGTTYSFNPNAGTATFGSDTYSASFGGTDASGLIHTVYLVRQTFNTGTSNPNCIDGINLTRQLNTVSGVPVR